MWDIHLLKISQFLHRVNAAKSDRIPIHELEAKAKHAKVTVLVTDSCRGWGPKSCELATNVTKAKRCCTSFHVNVTNETY
jgi:hypothetical protein